MLELGIHFGLPEEEHHADPGLGSSDHKALLVSPVQWQFKRLTGWREEIGLGDQEDGKAVEIESAAKLFGRAVHAMIEGADYFEARYFERPAQPEGLLTTKQQMRDALGARCTLPSGAGVYDHKVLVKMHEVGVLEEDWALAVAETRGEREEISRRWAATIRLIGRQLDAPRPSRDGKSLREVALTGGYPEVTVIWEEDGIRCKARIDYMRPAIWIDHKTFAMREGVEFVESFLSAVDRFAYDMQRAHYLTSWPHVQQAVRDGRVFGDVQSGFLDKVLARTQAPAWGWLAINTVGMPEVDLLEFPGGMVADAAEAMVMEARRKYASFREQFGEDRPWVQDRGRVILEDVVFRQSMMNRGSERWTTA